MRKRFLIPLLAALALPTTVEANWFGYSSRFEAKQACQSWISKKKYFICRDDKETRQVLALKATKKNFRIMKRFKY